MNARSGYRTQVVLGRNKVIAFLNGLLFGKIKMTDHKAAHQAAILVPWHYITAMEEAIHEQVAITELLVCQATSEPYSEDNPEVAVGIMSLEMTTRRKLLDSFRALCDAVRPIR